MNLAAYASATACTQGEELTFHVVDESGDVPQGFVEITDVPTGSVVLKADIRDATWTLAVPHHWPSSLYRATFSPGESLRDREVYFVLRSRQPGTLAKVVVAIPFITWQAYNRAGSPGHSIYWTEQPDRVPKVSFDRPGCGPVAEWWEYGLLRWLGRVGHPVEYCSDVDLHAGDEFLRSYQLLVVTAHEEYWTWEMRDTVEQFAYHGGNVAIFGGNTCWWQARLEDNLRTLVCYRDAVRDPLAATDPKRVTVEWSSAPVWRPENMLTGATFRRGAGCWTDMQRWKTESYVARFSDHWVFEGTGIRDGDTFARGAVGYETDSIEWSDIDGVPRATGRDGTPPSFVVLATADLRHWRDYGQGGTATMGIFKLGSGTVFNAGTVNWGNRLDDPVVERITKNVLDKLAKLPDLSEWVTIGPRANLMSLGACDNLLFGTTVDDVLVVREACAQNLRWQTIPGEAVRICCLAAPREAGPSLPVGLFGATPDGQLLYRDAVETSAPWRLVTLLPRGSVAIAVCNGAVFAATQANDLMYLPFSEIDASGSSWRAIGLAAGAIALAAMNGLLFAIDADDRLLARLPVPASAPWHCIGSAGGHTMLAGYAGMLVGAGSGGFLRWRPAIAAVPPAEAAT